MDKNTLMPLELERKILKQTTASMRYGQDIPLNEWQTAARERLVSLLGIPSEKCDDRFSVEYKEEKDSCFETRFVFQSEEGYFVPCHFLKPKNSEYTRPPVMICLQGHSNGMHISLGNPKYPGDGEDIKNGDRDFAVECIRQGFCAVTLEQRCFGERGGTPNPDCYLTAMTALLSGRTLIGGRVRDIMCLTDVLKKYFSNECDTDKICCMGNSGGGTTTIYAAAADTRISAAMPSCAFSTFSASVGAMNHCACNYVPSISEYFDMGDLAGLIAPRPLVIVSGEHDGIFPIDEARSEFMRARDVYYANSPAPDNIRHVVGPEGHRFYAALAWPEFKILLNNYSEN